MADEIRTKFSFDISEFKNNITAMNTGIRIAKNNFTAAAGALGDWKESQEGISAKMKSLNDIMELQRAKVEKLSKEYDDLKSSGTASEGAMQRLQVQVSKAAAELGKTEGEFRDAQKAQEKFGKETEDTTIELKDFADKTEDAGKKTNKFVGFLKSAGSVMKSGVLAGAKAVGASMAAIGTAAAGAAVGIFKLTTNAASAADDLLTLSQQTGVSVENLQKMQYASRFVDVELETMTGSMAKMIKSMGNATNPAKGTGEAFTRLGVAIRDQNGGLRDSQTVWAETLDALGSVANETERDALAMQIFGKSAQDLNPLIKAGSDELQRLGEEARTAGLILSDEMIKKLGGFDDQMERSKAQIEGLGKVAAVTFLPALSGIISTASGLMSEVSGALSDGFQPEDISKIGESVGKLLIDGVKKISEYLPGLIETVSSVLTEVVNTLVTILPTLLPVLLSGAMQLVQGVLTAIQANLQPLMDMAVTMMMAFTDFLLQNLPLVIEMGLQMIIALALGIAEALPTLIPTIMQTIQQIITVLMDNLPMIIQAGIQILLALVQGLINALPQYIAWLPTIYNSLIDAIMDNLPLIINAAIQIIVAITKGLLENLPLLLSSAIQIMVAIAGGLIEAIPQLLMAIPQILASVGDAFVGYDWAGLGGNIVRGIADGVGRAGGVLMDAVGDLANNALNGIKSVLGINSPSTVTRDEVGVNMGLGVAEGLASTSADVSNAMKVVTKDLTADVAVNGKVNVSGETGIIGGGSNSAILNITNFYNNTDSDLEEIAYKLEHMRRKAAKAMGG